MKLLKRFKHPRKHFGAIVDDAPQIDQEGLVLVLDIPNSVDPLCLTQTILRSSTTLHTPPAVLCHRATSKAPLCSQGCRRNSCGYQCLPCWQAKRREPIMIKRNFAAHATADGWSTRIRAHI